MSTRPNKAGTTITAVRMVPVERHISGAYRRDNVQVCGAGGRWHIETNLCPQVTSYSRPDL